MGTLETLPGPPRMPAVARILAGFDRGKVEAFIEVAIGLLDTFDAPLDPDTADFTSRGDGLPGDPGDHEPGGDEESGAYVEWHNLRAAARRRGVGIATGHEDDEEDDPAGQCDEDELNTALALARRHGGAGCLLSDPDFGSDDAAA